MHAPPPFDPQMLARHEMQRMARVRAMIADEHQRFGGLVAAWSGVDCWNSNADGWSPDTQTTRDDLEGVIAYYDERGDDARVTIVPHLDGGLLPDLESLGFRLDEVDLQLVVDVETAPLESPVYPDGVRSVALDTSNETRARLWSDLSAEVHSGRAPTEDERRLDARVISHPNTETMLVYAGDEAIGIGGVEVFDGLACLFMGGVIEAHRRRGIQLALINERLRIAQEMGARYAIIGSLPGSPTERNALRAGMRMVFPKLEFERKRS